MIANYHTHTWRCHHAEGMERQYIEQAIAAGIQILGFSDHTPYPFSGDYYSDYRMYLHQTEGYCQTLLDLKREYSGQIQLHIGVETEYYPALFSGLLAHLRQFPCEYMLLGQHFTCNESDGVYVYIPTADPAILTQYVNQTLEGLSTGMFTYLAHPDLLNWRGDMGLYRREMRRLCERVKAMGYALEFNLLGFYAHRSYPTMAFWEEAAQVGNTVILGVDAHEPEALNRPETEMEARRILADLGLAVLDQIDLRPIG